MRRLAMRLNCAVFLVVLQAIPPAYFSLCQCSVPPHERGDGLLNARGSSQCMLAIRNLQRRNRPYRSSCICNNRWPLAGCCRLGRKSGSAYSFRRLPTQQLFLYSASPSLVNISAPIYTSLTSPSRSYCVQPAFPSMLTKLSANCPYWSCAPNLDGCFNILAPYLFLAADCAPLLAYSL